MTVATVATSLQLTNGFSASEFDRVCGLLGRLDQRLRSYRADRIELLLGVKERDTASQRVVLEARAAGRPTMVGTSDLEDVDAAIIDAREDLIRQLTDDKNRSEPSNNRTLRTR